jgi:uncharacterized protein
MIPRRALGSLHRALADFPVVGILGPRQVGKTTLALEVARGTGKPTTYLDLELDSDRAALAEPELYLRRQADRLTVLDEVQRTPELFPVLRALVDLRIRAGERAGQFLVLGSATPALLRQSSESLAGRIAYHELKPFSILELAGDGPAGVERAWLRGGFPNSYLARDDAASAEWRGQFLSTYLERDLPQIGPRLPAELVRRTWTMLAHGQGDMINVARMATSLALSGTTVRRYVDVLTDHFLLRQLEPWSGNSTKRLVKSPKVYVRDSGLLHRLVGIADMETLLHHPILGRSWEGFAIEQILAHANRDWRASYYRTSAGAEIDLVLESPAGRVLAIEIKRTLAPRAERGFVAGCEEIGASERWYVMPEGVAHPIGHESEAIPLFDLVERLAAPA